MIICWICKDFFTMWAMPFFFHFLSTWIRYHSRFFVQVGHETMYAYSVNQNFFNISCHRQTYQNYERSRQNGAHFKKIKVGLLCSIRWIYGNQRLRLKTKTKSFRCWHFDFVIQFKKEDKKNFFPLLFSFLVTLNKSVQKSCRIFVYTTKNILDFSI